MVCLLLPESGTFFIHYFVLPSCILLFLLALSVGIYNRYLHSSSGIPGPFWGSVTKLYHVHIASSLPIKGLQLHKEYGPVVRLAPNLISFSDPRLLPVVYHKRADKTPFYSSWLFGNTAAMFQTLLHQAHARKKRILAPCCSMKMVRRFEDRLDTHIDAFCNAVRQRSSLPQKPLNFSDHIRWFLNDAFSDVVYGESLACVSAERDNGGLVRSLQQIYTLSGVVAILPNVFVPLVRSKLWQKFLFRHTKAFQGIHHLCTHYDSMRSKREQLGEKKPYFFDPIPSCNPSSMQTLTDEAIRAEAIIFTSAALEGVAAFISPFINNIIQHPSVYAKLRIEITHAEQSGALSCPVATYDETCRLTYFIACVYETLRHDAPAQTILPRYVSEPGIQAHGIWISAGTEMAASPYIIHRDKDIFGEDADDFRPERWMEDEGKREQMEKYGMWFGYGDRECPGKTFAHLEFQKLLVEIVRRFDFESAVVPGKGLRHERWAVAMFWNHWVQFTERV